MTTYKIQITKVIENFSVNTLYLSLTLITYIVFTNSLGNYDPNVKYQNNLQKYNSSNCLVNG